MEMTAEGQHDMVRGFSEGATGYLLPFDRAQKAPGVRVEVMNEHRRNSITLLTTPCLWLQI